MPNCDFYADLSDHEALLNWLFAEESCEIYELASNFEQPLQRFVTAHEVLSQFESAYVTGKKNGHCSPDAIRHWCGSAVYTTKNCA